MLVKGAQISLGLALQAHYRKDGDAIAQAFRNESGVIAANDAGFLQTADPSQERGGDEAHFLRKRDIFSPPILLQRPQDETDDRTENRHARHAIPSRWTTRALH